MELTDYQCKAMETAIYPHKGSNLIYTVLGLSGEAGELANKVKKLFRSYGLEPGVSWGELYNKINNISDPKKREKGLKIYNSVRGEVGGILWYVASTAFELGCTLEQIGVENVIELAERNKSGTIEGTGDRNEERK